MNFYKKLEVLNLKKLQEELLALVPSELLENPRVHFPKEQDCFFKIKELCDLLDRFNIPHDKTTVGYFICGSHTTIPIHIDFGDTAYSLNIPLKNCDNTTTQFYSTDRDPVLVQARTHNGVSYHPHYSFNGIKTTVIEEFEANFACIMHIKTPHNVINNTGNIRINALIRYSDNDHMKSIFESL